MKFIPTGSLNYFGSMIGSAVSGPVMVRFGQRATVLMTLPAAATLWLILSLSPKIWVLLVSRSCLGITAGILYTSASTYILEITHKSLRGRLFGGLSVSITVGALMLCILCMTGLYWRSVGFIVCTPLALSFFGILFLPNSPRWLVTRGRVSDARKSIIYFRGKHYDHDSELKDIAQQFHNTMGMINSPHQQLQLLFKQPVLQRLCLVTILAILQSFSCNALIFSYMVPIFQATHSSVDPYISAMICTAVVVLGNCC